MTSSQRETNLLHSIIVNECMTRHSAFFLDLTLYIVNHTIYFKKTLIKSLFFNEISFSPPYYILLVLIPRYTGDFYTFPHNRVQSRQQIHLG